MPAGTSTATVAAEAAAADGRGRAVDAAARPFRRGLDLLLTRRDSDDVAGKYEE
jgi:hypothetical protein